MFEPGLHKRNCFIYGAFRGTAWRHSSLVQREHGHASSPSSSCSATGPAAAGATRGTAGCPKAAHLPGKTSESCWFSMSSPPLQLQLPHQCCLLDVCLCTREAPARMRDSSSKRFIFVFKVRATKAQQPLAVRRKCCERGSRKL